MAYANTLDELRKMVTEEVFKAMKDNDRKNEQAMKKKYETAVEMKYTPKEYERTGQMKEASTSETKRVGDTIVTEVYTDTKKLRQDTLHPYATTFPTMQDFTEYLPVTIEEGLSGDWFGNGAWRKPRRYTKQTFTYLKNNYIKGLRASLIRQGLKVRYIKK